MTILAAVSVYLLMFGLFLALVYANIILVRNQQVAKYRSELLGKISKKNKEEIMAGDFDKWLDRHSYYESVEYETMVYQFWKPLESFYDMEKFNL